MGKETNQTTGMLTVREASQLLHVHINTLRRWSAQGIIKAYRIGPGRHRRFKAQDVATFIVEEAKRLQKDMTKL